MENLTWEQRVAEVRQALSFLGEVPEEKWEQVKSLYTLKDLKKGEHFLSVGEQPTQILFINRGLLRFFYTTADGKEFNKSFAVDGTFAGVVYSLIPPQPLRYALQALEPIQGLVIQQDDFNTICFRDLFWANVKNAFMELMLLRKIEREGSLLLDSAEERYLNFKQQYPDLWQRLPQYHVASFLGITEVGLSRIKKRVER